MNIFVTGGSGFIGRSLIEFYSFDQSNRITVLLRDYESRNEWLTKLNNVTIVYGDLTDINLLRRLIAEQEISHVFHCAAQSIVRICAQDPVSAYETNVMGTVYLLEAIRQVGMPHIKSIVVSTSDKAFGHSEPPYNEDTPLKPKYTYEATKSCQDIVSQNYFHNYGLPVKIARCSNVYGPGDPNTSRLIPNTIYRVLDNKAPQIYSEVAKYEREFIYIDDVVNAFNVISKHGVNGEAYCVGGTGVYKISVVVDKILALLGSTLLPEILVKSQNFKEIQSQYIISDKLSKLGWKPTHTLDQGLTETVAFYKGLHNVKNRKF